MSGGSERPSVAALALTPAYARRPLWPRRFEVYVGDSTDWTRNTRCNPDLLPANMQASPFWAEFPCQLTGRYVTVRTNLQGERIHICEFQAFAANRCPARATAFATTIAGTTCVGAGYNTLCVQQCLPGYRATAGSTSARCRGETWDAPPLVCEPVCADLDMPTNGGSCTQTLIRETFDAPAFNTSTVPILSRWSSLDETAQPLARHWFLVDNELQAGARPGCGKDLILLSNSLNVYNHRSAFTLTGIFRTGDQAGLVFKALDRFNYYRFVVDVGTGVHFLERNLAGVTTRIIDAPLPLDRTLYHTMAVVVSATAMDFLIDGTSIMTTMDMSLPVGYAGLFASTQAVFDLLDFSIPCASCLGLTPGTTCTFDCRAGLVLAGNATRTCVASGNGASAALAGNATICTLLPPVFFAAVRSVPENSIRNTPVGDPLVATITAPDEQVRPHVQCGSGRPINIALACACLVPAGDVPDRGRQHGHGLLDRPVHGSAPRAQPHLGL